jgi:hypothetical protein
MTRYHFTRDWARGSMATGLAILALAGCAQTMADVFTERDRGGGRAEVYPVPFDEAWEAARRMLRAEGGGPIEADKAGGYMVTNIPSVMNWSIWTSQGIPIGVWVEPQGESMSRVTIIVKPTTLVMRAAYTAEGLHEKLATRLGKASISR